MVGNHEIGGHGARAREFDLKVTKYEVDPFEGQHILKLKILILCKFISKLL